MLEELKKEVYEANMELPRRGLITYTSYNSIAGRCWYLVVIAFA